MKTATHLKIAFQSICMAILVYLITYVIGIFTDIKDETLIRAGLGLGITAYWVTSMVLTNYNTNPITKYNEGIQALYKHVGFEPDWVEYAVDDKTEYFWATDGNKVRYAESPEKLKNYYSEGCEDDVYTQRFYKKHVYDGKDYTMIFCDPHTDSTQWFKVFDNKKKMPFEVTVI